MFQIKVLPGCTQAFKHQLKEQRFSIELVKIVKHRDLQAERWIENLIFEISTIEFNIFSMMNLSHDDGSQLIPISMELMKSQNKLQKVWTKLFEDDKNIDGRGTKNIESNQAI